METLETNLVPETTTENVGLREEFRNLSRNEKISIVSTFSFIPEIFMSFSDSLENLAYGLMAVSGITAYKSIRGFLRECDKRSERDGYDFPHGGS